MILSLYWLTFDQLLRRPAVVSLCTDSNQIVWTPTDRRGKIQQHTPFHVCVVWHRDVRCCGARVSCGKKLEGGHAKLYPQIVNNLTRIIYRLFTKLLNGYKFGIFGRQNYLGGSTFFHQESRLHNKVTKFLIFERRRHEPWRYHSSLSYRGWITINK